jgi:Tfp pilus assembly protein FimT
VTAAPSKCPPQRDGYGHRAEAFTLFELLLIVCILAVVGMLAMPKLSGSSRIRLATAANVLAGDIEFCENECITNPQALRVIRFDSANTRYWIAPASSPTVPINHPLDSQPYLNDFATGRNARLSGTTISAVTLPNGSSTLTPDAYGCPGLASNATIILTDGQYKVTVTVDGSTGDVSISDLAPYP